MTWSNFDCRHPPQPYFDRGRGLGGHGGYDALLQRLHLRSTAPHQLETKLGRLQHWMRAFCECERRINAPLRSRLATMTLMVAGVRRSIRATSALLTPGASATT